MCLPGQLYVNGELVASIDMPFSVLRMFGTQGLTCGYDGGEPAAPEEYTGAFPFTGAIKRVTLGPVRGADRRLRGRPSRGHDAPVTRGTPSANVS